jgi:hypothetical protein
VDQRLIGRLWFLGVPGLLRRQSLGCARQLRRRTGVASRHDTLRGLTVVGALALAAGIAPPAYASALPTLLVAIRCAHPCTQLVGVYRVRPRSFELVTAGGPELKVHWSSWTATTASGSGTSTQSGMGTTEVAAISLRASDPVDGHFTHLALTSTLAGHSYHTILVLTAVATNPHFAPPSAPPTLGFTPKPNVGCGHVEIVDASSGTNQMVSVSVSLYRSPGPTTPTCATARKVTELWASTATLPPSYPPGFRNDASDSPPGGQQVANWRIDGPHHSQVIIGHVPSS